MTNEQVQVASFIGSHVEELALLARRAGLGTLCFLLEMATLEACSAAGELRGPKTEPD